MSVTTLRIRRISLPRARLSELPSAERNFLFLGGHILNELNSLDKVFMWCLNGRLGDSTSKISALARGVQSLVYARVLAGKLLEAWNELDRAWFGSQLSRKIEPRLHPDASSSLAVLKSYFSRTNPIFRVRNSFAFHYSAEQLGANWEEAAQGAELEVVLGGTIGNNLDLAAELVANTAVLNAVNPTNPEVGLQTFLDDVQSMTSHFTTFLEGAAIILLETTLGGKLRDHGREEELQVQQSFSEVQLPYFCAPDADKGA